MMVGHLKSAAALLMLVLVGACAAGGPATARLYNLDNGQVIAAELEHFSSGYGRITADMPDGERMTGEFTLASEEMRRIDVPARLATEGDEPWAQIYGFGRDVDARPVGTATLTGERGTVLEMVFYHINFAYGYGDGVGRNNKGNRYRVHIGKAER